MILLFRDEFFFQFLHGISFLLNFSIFILIMLLYTVLLYSIVLHLIIVMYCIEYFVLSCCIMLRFAMFYCIG